MRRSLAPSRRSLGPVPRKRSIAPTVGGSSPGCDNGDDSDSGSPQPKVHLPPFMADRKPLTPLNGNEVITAHEARIFGILGKPFKSPLPGHTTDNSRRGLGVRRLTLRQPLHDPDDDAAVVLYRPPPLSAADASNPEIRNKHPVAVVVDPILGAKLRPHQIEGVQFLYDCVTGLKIPGYHGAIMADGMGLGKTLQNVTLTWTLLKQSPECRPTLTKAVIVCPSSLVKNWSNEFRKWLGDRVSTLPIDNGASDEIDKKLRYFGSASGRAAPQVLIISYETLRGHIHALDQPVGIVICDEGHRLKNSENQTYRALMALKTERRVILSGTPVQNELLEYYALLEFVNPGLLGSAGEFRKKFEIPILRGRDADATAQEQELGQTKLNEMVELVNRCLIRRTSDILSKYLPPKIEAVVCCRLTGLQLDMYKRLIDSQAIALEDDGPGKTNQKKSGGSGPTPLAFITHLKKLCNHPELIMDKIQAREPGFAKLQDLVPAKWDSRVVSPEWSGKVMVVDAMLAMLKSTTDEKVVLISNYTQTLDLFERLCRQRRYKYVRLDGTMSIKKRQKVVDHFNAPDSDDFIFMLSSKAGGCGINLIGASRLILTDPDWNPASDAQALARCWRDGQRRITYVYRLVATGTIEEKILARQAHKTALSDCVIDEAEDVQRHFSLADLRRLFTLNEGTTSDLHAQFKCGRCSRDGTYALIKPDGKPMGIPSDFSQWDHYPLGKGVKDRILSEAGGDLISFVFRAQSHEAGKRVDEVPT
ncbi:uncharacterized protein MONBRDRAFT_10186 [Monosiga brevicollis MX1]|uniref:DNA repair and recombination protein RAD54-like n=1 Tax=Monosiga brevicollis TaxID=81824 RepID=A9V5G6_MONBE|nr:uncharacterized protein MONBRDRAFT_10186 [Monosiga brevicollis MX1]EDQ87367.1 predicted protein [Monosiga brevicollis MX1]|eukprot:XP_001747980.1 hypothetical protein [Monosiga brevicollis MX1]